MTTFNIPSFQFVNFDLTGSAIYFLFPNDLALFVILITLWCVMTTSGFLPIYFFRRLHIFSVVPLRWFLMLTMKDSMLIYNLTEAAIADIFYLHSFYVFDYGLKVLRFWFIWQIFDLILFSITFLLFFYLGKHVKGLMNFLLAGKVFFIAWHIHVAGTINCYCRLCWYSILINNLFF